ncbi:hypothetical protein D3OALGA1CA_4098 [Olavius algarvensis associated proteobacterium Delta 3]|nr:hypothetical protein D3OALGA1CA_4098 [Olavius algarvensis associated proteobacterium Delta 3]
MNLSENTLKKMLIIHGDIFVKQFSGNSNRVADSLEHILSVSPHRGKFNSEVRENCLHPPVT